MLPNRPIFSVTPDGRLERPGSGGAILWLFRLGRPGGAIALALGAALVWGTLRDVEATGGYWIAMPAVGIALALMGTMLLVFGNGERRALKHVTTVPIRPSLSILLEQHARPFVLCIACRDVTEAMHCHRCGSSQHTLSIQSASDVAIAVAALESA